MAGVRAQSEAAGVGWPSAPSAATTPFHEAAMRGTLLCSAIGGMAPQAAPRCDQRRCPALRACQER